jgi:RNA polymerase sigma factor (sigma-70 family)
MGAERRTLSARRRNAPDSALVTMAANGDAGAFEELVGRHQRVVFSIARSCGLGRDDAADVTQVAFAALADALPRLEDGDRVRSWLCTVARRHSWRVLARRDRESLGDPPDRASDADLPARVATVVDLVDALEQLRPRCRDLLTALYFREPPLDYAQASVELTMPIGSIGPTRARCLDQLRSIVESQ